MSEITSALIESQKLTEKIENLLFETGGELNQELEDLLKFDLDQKDSIKATVDQYALTIDRIESIATHYSKQAMAIARILEGLESAKSRIESNVMTGMQSLNLDVIRGHQMEFKIRNNPASLEILDETKIPQEFIDITMTTKVRKNDLKDAIKQGLQIDGARLIQKQSLKINLSKPELTKGI